MKKNSINLMNHKEAPESMIRRT